MTNAAVKVELRSRVTCPHCWRQFAPEDVLWVASHPDLPLLTALARWSGGLVPYLKAPSAAKASAPAPPEGANGHAAASAPGGVPALRGDAHQPSDLWP